MKYRVYVTDQQTGLDHDFTVDARSEKDAFCSVALDSGWRVRRVGPVERPTAPALL